MEKKMSNIKYVIRKKIFEYQGNYYSLTDYQIGEIVGVYDEKLQAEQQFKQLIIDTVRDQDLYCYDVSSYVSTDVIEAVNQQILHDSGVEIYSDGDLLDVVPDTLSDENTLLLAEKFGILHYLLEEFDDENYVIWNIEKEHYLRLPDPYGNPFDQDDSFCGELIWGKTADFLKHHAEKKRFLEQFNNEFRLYQYGELSELSEQPEQLEQTLQKYSDTWKYENNRLELQRYVQPNFDTFEAVHSLLKTPLYEIRKVDFATLKDLIDLEETREVR